MSAEAAHKVTAAHLARCHTDAEVADPRNGSGHRTVAGGQPLLAPQRASRPTAVTATTGGDEVSTNYRQARAWTPDGARPGFGRHTGERLDDRDIRADGRPRTDGPVQSLELHPTGRADGVDDACGAQSIRGQLRGARRKDRSRSEPGGVVPCGRWTRRTEEAHTGWPRRASSPSLRWWPQFKWRRTIRRCQPRSVSGLAKNADQPWRGSNRLSNDSHARSGGSGRGRPSSERVVVRSFAYLAFGDRDGIATDVEAAARA